MKNMRLTNCICKIVYNTIKLSVWASVFIVLIINLGISVIIHMKFPKDLLNYSILYLFYFIISSKTKKKLKNYLPSIKKDK